MHNVEKTFIGEIYQSHLLAWLKYRANGNLKIPLTATSRHSVLLSHMKLLGLFFPSLEIIFESHEIFLSCSKIISSHSKLIHALECTRN